MFATKFPANILTLDTGTDATSPQIGFGRDATTEQSTGPRWVHVTVTPVGGALFAPGGSIASGVVAGVGHLYLNTSPAAGGVAWVQVA
jgi:hypothetical protein